MLSRGVLAQGKSLQGLTKLAILLRYQSTGTVAIKDNENERSSYVHPVSKLGNGLNEQLKSPSIDLNEVYSTFTDELRQLSQDTTDPTSLQRSFGLNAPLIALLRKSTDKVNSKVDPYQILNTMCQYQVARSPHFEIVLRYLLTNESPQDVIALWVKYLETIAENPNALTQSFRNRNGNNNSHETNAALATLAYLLLPENKPDINVLYQILQFDKDAGQKISFSKVRFLVNSVLGSQPERKLLAINGINSLFHQYVSCDKGSFLREIDQTLQFYHLQDLYNQYHDAGSDTAEGKSDADPEILAKFMDKFVSFSKPNNAVKIFNDYKSLDSPIIKEHLLIAVASLPANSRSLRLDRILAVWNSLIKPTDPTASSFASLIQALGFSGNITQLQTIWNKEIPAEFKSNTKVIEAYLSAMLKYSSKISYESIADKLPEKIESIDLINAVLIKMIKGDVSMEKFDSFYSSQFMGKDEADTAEIQRRPTVETLSIKMWANYHYTKDKSDFQFFRSIHQSNKNLLRANAIVQSFVKVVTSIEPIRALYEQIKEPLDSRKYGYFIDAEFMKYDGEYEVAEQIFKDYLQACKDQPKKLDKFVVEPLITGFCERAVREKDASFLLKVSTYVAFASKIGVELTYQTTAKILHVIAMLAKENSGNFDASEQKFIDSFLSDLAEMENFQPHSRDMDMLRNANIKLPSKLM